MTREFDTVAVCIMYILSMSIRLLSLRWRDRPPGDDAFLQTRHYAGYAMPPSTPIGRFPTRPETAILLYSQPSETQRRPSSASTLLSLDPPGINLYYSTPTRPKLSVDPPGINTKTGQRYSTSIQRCPCRQKHLPAHRALCPPPLLLLRPPHDARPVEGMLAPQQS